MIRRHITAHIFSHSFYNMSANSLRFLISAAMVVYLARRLGPDQYGIVSLGLSIAVIIGVFCDFGITTSTARYLAESNIDEKDMLYNTGFLLNMTITGIFTVLFLILCNPIAKITNINSSAYFYAISGLIFFTTTFYYSIRSLQGIKKTDKVAVLIFFQTLITNLLIFVAVTAGFKARETLWAYSLAAMVSWFISLMTMKRYFTVFTFHCHISIMKRILLYALPLLLTSSLYFLILQGPVVILSANTSSTEVAYLNIPLKITEVLSLPAYSISLVCCPFFTAQDQTVEDKKWLYVKITKYVLLFYVPISLFLSLISKEFIQIVFGTAYERASNVLLVLALYAPFFALTNFSGTVLDFLGIARQKSLVFAAFTGIAVVMSIILIPNLKEIGAGLSIAVPYTFFSVYTVIVSSRKCQVKITKYILHLVKLLLVTATSLLPVKYILNYSHGLLELIIAFFTFLIVFSSLTLTSKILHVQEIKNLFSLLKTNQ